MVGFLLVIAFANSRGDAQYTRDRWETDQGFPGGAVSSIAQTADGYLWIGTDKGLLRFDGLTFQPVARSADPSAARASSGFAPITNVMGLTTDADGSLWVRLQDPRIVRLRGDQFEDLTTPIVRTEVGFTLMTRDRAGAVILAGLRSGLIRQKAAGFETLVAPPDLPRTIVISLAEADGTFWIGTRDAGAYVVHGSKVTAVPEGVPDRKVNCLLQISDRELWIGSDNGIARWDGTQIERPAMPLDGAQVLAMARDHEGNLWVGTSRGLVRLDRQGGLIADERDPRSGVAITALFEDRESNMWVGSARGLERVRSTTFRTFTSSDGLPAGDTGPVYVDSQNRTWFAPTDGGLYRMKDGRVEQVLPALFGKDVIYSIEHGKDGLWIGRQHGGLTQLVERDGRWSEKTYTARDGLAQNSVYAAHQAADGSVWAGTLSGGVTRIADGSVRTYTVANGLAANTVSSIAEGSDRTLWFGTPQGLSGFSGGAWERYGAADGLPTDDVTCLLVGSDGTIWVGTSSGLAWLRAGHVERPVSPVTALAEHVVGIAEDRHGWLWLATSSPESSHIFRVRRNALLERTPVTAVREYGAGDGLRSVETMKRHRSVVADGLGRIWFSTTRGLSVVDASRQPADSAPAIVHIKSMAADGAAVDLRAPIHVPAARRRLTFNYSGLSLSVPDRVQFRYRLDGFDHEWSDPMAAGETAYTNLSPGEYTFRVIASNSEGLWNGTEAALGFNIDPVFWQTWWFQLSLALGVGLTMLVLYRIRVHQVSRQLSLRFDERLAERTRIAQELHDTLLQGFISASMQLHVVADRLPENSPAKGSLGRVIQLMSQVIDEGRSAVKGLRSHTGKPQDLEQAFSGIQQELMAGGDIAYRVIVEGQPRELNPIIRDEVYRIGREALTNAFRHSGAKAVELELEYAPSHLRVLVRDDGSGIAPGVVTSGAEGHWGLSGMRERAERIGARFKVFSRAAAGTEIELSIPAHIAFHREDADRENGWLTKLRQRLTAGRQSDGRTER